MIGDDQAAALHGTEASVISMQSGFQHTSSHHVESVSNMSSLAGMSGQFLHLHNNVFMRVRIVRQHLILLSGIYKRYLCNNGYSCSEDLCRQSKVA